MPLSPGVENAFEYTQPVFCGHPTEFEGVPAFYIDPPGILGTAFPVGGGRYLTAGHVVSGRAAAEMCLGFVEGDACRHGRVIETEVLPGVDVAVMEVSEPTSWAPRLLTWCPMDMLAPALADVRVCGFPFGLNLGGEIVLNIRSFKGYIVSAGLMTNEYELSFPAPEGLSGAPLQMASGLPGTVGGIIVGSAEVFTVVSTRTE